MKGRESAPPGMHRPMASWSQLIETFGDIPAPFVDACRPMLAEIQPFPTVVFAPVVQGFRRKTTEKLVAEIGDHIHIWERAGSQIITTTFAVPDISLLEMGHVLLYSWIAFQGVTVQGEVSFARVEFNTVSTPLFIPFLRGIRPSSRAIREDEWQKELAKFDFLETANYKFMNYARESLRPGEEVLHVIWQPKLRRPLITLFGWSFYRTLFLAHLAVLTDQELILISDDPRLTEVRGERHGGIWQYVPLQHIQAASLTAESHDVLTLSLTLYPGSHRLEKRFAAAQEQDLTQFQGKLESLIGAVARV